MSVSDPSDGHVHTELCRHATGSMEQYVISAIDRGLRHICFLEHMEEGIDSPRTTWLSEEEFDQYFEEGRRLQEVYGDRITIGMGVEVGFNPEQVDALRHRLARRHWDSIGISYHFHRPGPGDAHINLVSKKEPRLNTLSMDEAAAIEHAYYTHLARAVTLLPGTVLCHVDAALRYYPRRAELEPPWPLIEKLLDTVKSEGIALEVNTSGRRLRGEFYPSSTILAMAKTRGIPLSWGSDAHSPEDVANHFPHRSGRRI